MGAQPLGGHVEDQDLLDEFQLYEMAKARKRAMARQQVEQGAPRLAVAVPSLRTLRISITEHHVLHPLQHVKHIVVDRAPALFKLPCHDQFCREGGYDVTALVMRGLRAREAKFTGNQSCEGRVGQHPCRRTMSFQAIASYDEPVAAE